MKATSLDQFIVDVQGLMEAVQNEHIVVTRDGKPLALVVGLENKDDEDLRLEMSPAFWEMIAASRLEPTVPLEEVEAELFADEK
jgi:antitoxin (DNA-binding transcriptional repressor) of toxin-antitoxin stability system